MNDYEELIELLAHPADGRDNADVMIAAADAIEQLVKERDELRNELCLRCGEYTEAHNGACNGCRWRETDDN